MFALLCVALLLVLLAWRLLVAERAHGLAAAVAAGKAPAAPDFELPRLDAPGKLRLSTLPARLIVLNFWASWCVPCKEEAPRLQAAWEHWRSRGVVVLGLNAQDFKSDARRFMRRYGLAYPNVHDGGGETVGGYGVTGFPETWFVRDGRLVVDHVAGPIAANRLERDIARALR